jgi:hypothetical protein
MLPMVLRIMMAKMEMTTLLGAGVSGCSCGFPASYFSVLRLLFWNCLSLGSAYHVHALKAETTGFIVVVVGGYGAGARAGGVCLVGCGMDVCAVLAAEVPVEGCCDSIDASDGVAEAVGVWWEVGGGRDVRNGLKVDDDGHVSALARR